MHQRQTHMRKIERQMCEAIRNTTDWKSGNTRVTNFYNDNKELVVTSVFLHDNLIAEVTDNDVTIYDGGWQSVATESRLNSLINDLCDGRMFGVFQRQHQWYINDGVVTVDFEHGYNFPRI